MDWKKVSMKAVSMVALWDERDLTKAAWMVEMKGGWMDDQKAALSVLELGLLLV